MPGTVPNASPTVVFPISLSKAFTRSKELLALDNQYPNGESQRSLLVGGFRASWTMTKRLDAVDMATLLTFLDSVQGGLIPFWFYDPFETSPEFTGGDPTGVATAGRYAAKLKSETYGATIGLGRAEMQLELIQVS